MRRRDVIAGIVAAGAAVAAGVYRFTDIFVKHYAPTPYDDVLGLLLDREQAARLGAHVSQSPGPAALAGRLRASLKPGLAAAAEAEVAQGLLVEVDGWVLPQSVALLAALASRV